MGQDQGSNNIDQRLVSCRVTVMECLASDALGRTLQFVTYLQEPIMSPRSIR